MKPKTLFRKRASSKAASKPNGKPKFTIASGSAIGKRATKIMGCTACSYAEPLVAYQATQKSKADKDNSTTTSGSKAPAATERLTLGASAKVAHCPRCHTKALRLFDSKAEYVYSRELQALQNKGLISDLDYQVRFDLHGVDVNGKRNKVTSYVADFAYTDTDPKSLTQGDYIVVDVKGGNSREVVVSPEAKLKMKWMKAEHGIDVQVIGR